MSICKRSDNFTPSVNFYVKLNIRNYMKVFLENFDSFDTNDTFDSNLQRMTNKNSI